MSLTFNVGFQEIFDFLEDFYILLNTNNNDNTNK